MANEELSEDMQEKIGQLQMMEQNMQNFTMQKQMTQSKLMEVESALEELDDSEEAYKIVGNIMVASKKDKLQDELKEKQETLKRRLESLESQEGKMREKAQSLQDELLSSMK